MTVDGEYVERPVPKEARLGFFKPAMVWAGFAHAYICIFIGSQIMGGLGAPLGYVAIIGGQIFLFVYSGLIAHKGSQLGLNFSMMCKTTFGKYGYIIPVLLIAGLVSGWFIFQAWLAADLTVGLYGGKSFNAGTGNGSLPGILGTTSFWAGIFTIAFGMFAVLGIKAMAWLGKVAVFCVAALEIWMIITIVTVVAAHTGGNPFSSAVVGKQWSFALGFTASVGTFIVSSTMTGDFVRWTKTAKQAWAVTGVAFPVCNLVTLLIGGIFTAIAVKLDFFFGLAAVAFGIPMMIMQVASNGSVCDGCLYNATQGFKNIVYYVSKGKVNMPWRKMAAIIMILGAGVAIANLITNIVPWLLVLGTLAPLVGGVLIGHFWLVARRNTLDEHMQAADKRYNVPALIGLGSGLAIAVILQIAAPDLPPVLGGLIGGIGIYPLIAKTTGYTLKGKLTAKGLGINLMDSSDSKLGNSHGGSPSDFSNLQSSNNSGNDKKSLSNVKSNKFVSKLEKMAEFMLPGFFNKDLGTKSFGFGGGL